jgi:hypothetical protein
MSRPKHHKFYERNKSPILNQWILFVLFATLKFIRWRAIPPVLQTPSCQHVAFVLVSYFAQNVWSFSDIWIRSDTTPVNNAPVNSGSGKKWKATRQNHQTQFSNGKSKHKRWFARELNISRILIRTKRMFPQKEKYEYFIGRVLIPGWGSRCLRRPCEEVGGSGTDPAEGLIIRRQLPRLIINNELSPTW